MSPARVLWNKKHPCVPLKPPPNSIKLSFCVMPGEEAAAAASEGLEISNFVPARGAGPGFRYTSSTGTGLPTDLLDLAYVPASDLLILSFLALT